MEPRTDGSALRTRLYVDGYNLYYGCLKNTPHKWLDLPLNRSSARKILFNRRDEAVWRWDPSPFGDTLPDENTQGIGTFVYNLRFPGQYFDGESGLNHNYSRDYDQATG